MDRPITPPPSAGELHAFSLGKCQPERAAEIEAFLTAAPDCAAVLDSAPDDTLLRSLRGTGTLTAALPDEDGHVLRAHPRYRVIRKLGQGGMGTVYLAEHRLMGRRVAIKLIRTSLLTNPLLLERFRQEVRAAARLAHAQLVTAYDAEEVGGVHFLVMEYVEGETLNQRVTRSGPLPIAEACDCIYQAAVGLAFVHQHGMVHRDIKPHNLIRAADGTVKILDFGLARLRPGPTDSQGQATAPGVVLGTADYMAPEQLHDCRSVDIRADLYSLGCTFFYLLTGQVLARCGVAAPKLLRRAGVPAAVAQIVDSMTRQRPDERMATPAELAAALAPLRSPPLRVRRSGKQPWRGRRRWTQIAVCGALLLGLFAALPYVLPGDTHDTPDPGAALPAASAAVGLRFERRLAGLSMKKGRFYFSPDGCYLLGITDKPGNALRVWEVATGQPRLAFDGGELPFGAVFMPDRRLLVLHPDKAIRLWDLATGAELDRPVLDYHRLVKAGNLLYLRNISPDGRVLAASEFSPGAGPVSRQVLLIDLDSGQELLRVVPYAVHGIMTNATAFSADSERFFVMENDSPHKFIREFSVPACRPLRRRRIKCPLVYPAISHVPLILRDDGEQVGTLFEDGDRLHMGFIDMESGRRLVQHEVTRPSWHNGLAMSQDARAYAMIDADREQARFFEVASNREILADGDLPDGVRFCMFSADGRYTVLGGPSGIYLYRLLDTAETTP